MSGERRSLSAVAVVVVACLVTIAAAGAGIFALITTKAPLWAPAVVGAGALVAACVTLISFRALTRTVRAVVDSSAAAGRGEMRTLPELDGWTPAEAQALVDAVGSLLRHQADSPNYVTSFVSQVTHQFKGPLTSIRGAVELLIDDRHAMPDAQRESFLRDVDREAARMEQMVSRLLDLAKIGNPMPQSLQSVDVTRFFADLRQQYGAKINIEIHSPPHTIIINAMQLHAAVSNLIDNAIRHSEGRPVEVNATRRQDRLCVSVRDSGPGISVANRAKLFEPFFTTERKRGGTGLGLAIVKAVAEARRGSVSVESTASGSVFTLVV